MKKSLSQKGKEYLIELDKSIQPEIELYNKWIAKFDNPSSFDHIPADPFAKIIEHKSPENKKDNDLNDQNNSASS